MYLSGRTQVLAHPVETCLRVIRDAGFDGVELCLENKDISPPVLDEDRARRLGDFIHELGLFPCSVSYHKDYIHNDQFFEETKRAIGLTPAFGSRLFVFAGGGRTGEPGEWDLKVERTRQLVQVAEDCDVTLAEEFEPHFIVGSTADLHRLFDAIPSENLTANLDLGHVFLCDPDPMEAIASLEGKVSHCHVENMASGIHRHLPPEQGDMDLHTYMAALCSIGFDGPLALDLYGCDYEAAARKSIPFLRQVIGEVQRKDLG